MKSVHHLAKWNVPATPGKNLPSSFLFKWILSAFRLGLVAVVAGTILQPGGVSAQEFRAMWADAFHAGLRNSTETAALMAAARAARCNAVIVQMRKRGDAYYRGGLEPVATDVAAGFDPLADLIQRGHSGNPRIEIHAWVVTYNIWNNRTTPPSQPSHPYNLHPDWLCENTNAVKWDGGNYQLDPGHPAVQQHTFNVVMDIVRRYDIDGIHFDYVRYTEHGSGKDNQPWGYNPVTVARFKRLHNVTATPAPTNALWLQWRRDQVSALVRKVYLNTWALKPHVRVSAATIPWGNPPALTLASWQNTDAFARVLQDWRGWMEEGILDLACPMVYRNQSVTPGFDGWADFTKDRQYGRAAAIGMGWYMNSISNTIYQIGEARQATPSGKTAVGVVGYSYAVPNNTNTSQSATWSALVAGPFSDIVSVPSMPWKTNLTRGHAMGMVSAADNGEWLDGASVSITGATNRSGITDATGFFGLVDLPVGNYNLNVSAPGFQARTVSLDVIGALVTQTNLQLQPAPFHITSTVRSAASNALTITWNSMPGRAYRVEQSTKLSQWAIAASSLNATSTTTSYTWPIPSNWTTNGYLRVMREP